jgi:two-component system LytT family sensor kinase
MLVSAAWVGPAILGGLDVVMQGRLRGETASWDAILFTSLDWLLYGVLTPGVFAIARRWPLARVHLVRRALLHLAASIAFCGAWAGAGTLLKAWLQPDALAGGAGLFFTSWLFITLPFGVAVYFAVVAIEHAARYLADARDRELQVARLSELLSEARFAELQAQVNPHFLFNTLNTVTVLVRDGDRSGALHVIEELSELLRRTLSRHRHNEVPLTEELALVRHYLAIEQARFPDRLRVTIDAGDTPLSAAVPGFALQHLVENAIRHGVAKRIEAGLVLVRIRRDGDTLELSVSDDGPGMSGIISAGHGIENTRERLRALYGGRGALTTGAAPGGGTIATLRVPFREMALEADHG